MSVGDFEVPGGIVPEFKQLVDDYADGIEFEAPARRVLDAMIARGSSEVSRIRDLTERRDAIGAASARLEQALGDARRQFLAAGTIVTRDELTAVMEPLCPVPPFCLGQGPDATTLLSSDEGPAVATDTRELAGAGA